MAALPNITIFRNILIFTTFLLFSLLISLNFPSTSNLLLSITAPTPSVLILPFSNPDHTSSFSNKSSCDIFDGRWVFDLSDRSYKPATCPYVEREFNCFKNSRSDLGYLRYRWQPHGCDIPRFNETKMIEMIRGKRLVFVGDSLNRNMCQSLVCSLWMFKWSRVFKPGATYSYTSKDYNSSILFITAPFLVQQWQRPGSKETLRLDTMEETASKYHDADILIFNTGQWWNFNKVKNGQNYFQEGEIVHSKMDVEVAYTKALNTWAKWVDTNVNPHKTQVFYVTYSPSHFIGGQWNTGGSCENETELITAENDIAPATNPWMTTALESVISNMSTLVVYLNITKMSAYRKDAHPSIYRYPDRRPNLAQDCVHWCLPGVPDSWNQLLYALLVNSKD